MSTTKFRTWTASTSGEVRHYFTGRVSSLVGITFTDRGVLDEVNGVWDIHTRDRSRLVNSVRDVEVWVDTDGKAHVTGWDPRLTLVSTADVARAVEAAYAAEKTS